MGSRRTSDGHREWAHKLLDVACAVARQAEAQEAAVCYDQGAIAELLPIMDYPPSYPPTRALRSAVSQLRDEGAVPLVVALLSAADRMPDDCSRVLPHLCATAAAAIDDPRALAALAAAVVDTGQTLDLRCGVADALGERGDSLAIPALRSVVAELDRAGHGLSGEGDQAALLIHAVTALGRLGDDSGSDVAVRASSHQWSRARCLAIEALRVLRPAGLVGLLTLR